ncbi:PREDICTED: uncharacterized protein LOC106099221 [Papilio polytes]|uniref:uncharacterized protein LOC106099221 n=1 Tax=Papilio polytes TaxID=76194 RepID=UPI0006760EEA|nr:PREDICTED: uncharacterized protein LOC106099221 [Papilio polytes]
MRGSRIFFLCRGLTPYKPRPKPFRKFTLLDNTIYQLCNQYCGLSYRDVEAAYSLYVMANPSKNLPPTMQLRQMNTVRADDVEETDAVYENLVTSTVDNSTDATDGAIAGPSGSQRQETEEPAPVPTMILYDATKRKQMRRRKQKEAEYSSDSTSDDENVILARIQATKRKLEKAGKLPKAQPQGGQKKKKM